MMFKVVLLLCFSAGLLGAEEWEDLWKGEAPGALRPVEGSEKVEKGSRYTDVEVPQYRLYRPKEPNGMGIVILPGGGYSLVSMEKEGYLLGRWCAERGITAMVVKYRVSRNPDFGYQFPVPQLDARRALRVMRSQGEEWGVNQDNIGVLGASAGGHLASTCATMFTEQWEENEDAIDRLSCRPDFAVLLYPVIGVGEPWGHQGTTRRLLGEAPTAELVQQCATHLRVTKETPPVFILHAADDTTVPLRNSAEFMSACAEKGVSVRAAIYPTGGHGFGGEGRGACKSWLSELEAWLATL